MLNVTCNNVQNDESLPGHCTNVTGNALSPTVDRRVRRTTRDVDEAEHSRHLYLILLL